MATVTSAAQSRPVCDWVHDMAVLIEAQKQNGQLRAVTAEDLTQTAASVVEVTIIQILIDRAYRLPRAPVDQRYQWISQFGQEQRRACLGS